MNVQKCVNTYGGAVNTQTIPHNIETPYTLYNGIWRDSHGIVLCEQERNED